MWASAHFNNEVKQCSYSHYTDPRSTDSLYRSVNIRPSEGVHFSDEIWHLTAGVARKSQHVFDVRNAEFMPPNGQQF